jgi:hypothetical protein
VRSSGRLRLGTFLSPAGSVIGLAGIVAEGIGQGGMQGEHAVQPGDAKDTQDQPLGNDQVDAAIAAMAAQVPLGANQHA